MARNAISRSADGATIIALLPPSSRMHLPNRAATFGPTARPIRVEPVAETIVTSRCATMRVADVGRADEHLRQAHAVRRRSGRRARSKIFWVASARQRRLFGRFPDHGIAADDRERGVPAPRRHRKVERGDDAAHAGRVPRLAHRVAGTFRRHRQPVELPRQTDREVADVDHLLHLAETLLQDLAGLDRHQFAEVALRLRAALRRTGAPVRRDAAREPIAIP